MPVATSTNASRLRSSSTLIACALIVVSTCLAYSNSFHGPFIRDDLESIANNDTIRQLWPLHTVLTPPRFGFTVHARPVLNLSFALDYALHGLDVRGYHITNLLIHILNALLLFGLVRSTLQCSGFSVLGSGLGIPGSNAGRQTQNPELIPHPTSLIPHPSMAIAFAIAILWSLHPIQTESVTYMVQRAESLMAFFFLLTLYALHRSATVISDSTPDTPTLPYAVTLHRRLWSLAAVVACALGMATKEVMVAAPVLALAYDRIFLCASWRGLWKQRGFLHLGLLATLGIQVWLLAGHHRIAYDLGQTASRFTPWQYLLTQANVIPHYLRLTIWPDRLCFDYFDWPMATSPRDVWPGLLLTGGLCVATLAGLRRHPKLAFLGLWFFAILAPTSSFMPLADVVYEHRLYLPLAAVITLFILALHHALRAAFRNHRFVFCLLTSAFCLLLALLTHHRNHAYQSLLAIWTDASAKRPANPRALYHIGWCQFERGDTDAAIQCFNRTIELAPGFATAYYSRGESFFKNQNYSAAVQDFSRALELAPQGDFVLNARGRTYMELGAFDQALNDFTQAIALRPDFGDAYNNRAALLLSMGQPDAARSDLERCRQIGYTPNATLVQMVEDARNPP